MSVQLNLLPDVKKEYINAQRTKNVIVSASILVTIVAVGLVLLAATYVYGLQPGLLSASNSNIDKKVNELQSVKDVSSILTVQNQLKVLTKLHDQKPVYSRMFDYLLILNPAPPNAISLSSVQVNQDDKSITLVGTTESYETFSVFKDTLSNAKLEYKKDGTSNKEPLFTGISIQNQNVAKDGRGNFRMNFTVSLVYGENAFNFTVDGATVTVPNIETTQSVINAPGYDPSKLFDAAAHPQVEVK